MRPNGADESTPISCSLLPKSPFMSAESAAAAATAENGALTESTPAIEAVDSAATGVSGAPFDQYRMHLYNYALQAQAERLRFVHNYGASVTSASLCPTFAAAAAAAATAAATSGAYAPRWPFPISLFQNRLSADEPKPQYSYIGLIAMAILSSPDSKLVLSDIYQYILDNYPYFRSRGPGWRNSIRHNLSLNDCFIKAGRSANGKGHYWAIHPANIDDFKKGDFRRRKAQRKVRKHMGLAVDDDGNDSPSPPPITPPPPPPPPPPQQHRAFWPTPFVFPASLGTCSPGIAFSRKRQFDVASLLAPDDASSKRRHRHLSPPPPPYALPTSTAHLQFLSSSSGDEDDALTDVDVTAGADLSAPGSPNSAITVTSEPPTAHAFAPPPSSWTLGAALSSATGLSLPQHQQLVAKYYERLNEARTVRLYQQLQMQRRRLRIVDAENVASIEEVENSG